MQFLKRHQTSEKLKQEKLKVLQSFADIKNRCSSLLKRRIEITADNLTEGAKSFLSPGFLQELKREPVWARISSDKDMSYPVHQFDLAMNMETIEERLAGIAVYALSNSSEEFVLVSGVKTGKSLGLFCFRKEDAEALLDQMKSMDPGMRKGSKVVAVALNKVFQLKVDGVAFRFIPDSHQIYNALKEMEKMGDSVADGFEGVPVFQSRSLILSSQNKRYRPVFFRKEDLENSLYRASQQQKYLNPSFKKGDTQVFALEDIIHELKENYTSDWDDVVFIPPGYDISTNISQQARTASA